MVFLIDHRYLILGNAIRPSERIGQGTIWNQTIDVEIRVEHG